MASSLGGPVTELGLELRRSQKTEPDSVFRLEDWSWQEKTLSSFYFFKKINIFHNCAEGRDKFKRLNDINKLHDCSLLRFFLLYKTN